MWDVVKKFGLERCDLPTMIWNISVTLRILTVNINRQNKRIPVAFLIFTGFLGISYSYVYGVSNIWFVFWRCRETKDLQTATIFLSIQLASEFGPLRMLFMIYYKSKITDIVEKYLEYDSVMKAGNTSDTLLKRLRTVKKRALIFWFIIVGNGLGYLIKPLLLPGKHFIEDNQVIFGLEPLYDSPNYEIAYVLTAGGIIFVLYTTAHTTAFFIVLIGYTEAQLCTMSENLTCLWDDAQRYCNEHLNSFNLNKTRCVNKNKDEEITSKILNKFVKKRLNEIIKYHTINIDLIKQIEETFRGCIVLEYILLTTALVAVLLGGLENTYIELPFSLLLVSVNCFMGIPIVFYIMSGLIGISYLYVYGVSNMWFVFWRCRETKDLKTATIFLSIQLASEIGPLRMLFMLYHKTKIMYIVEKYLKYDESINSGRSGGTLLTHLRTIKKRALTSWIIIVGNCLTYLVKPLLLPGKRFVQDDQVIIGLEPLHESPNYDLAYLLVSGGITFVAYTSSHTTAFFIILIGYTESQLLSMSDSLTCLWDDAQRFCDTHRNRFGFKVGRSNIEDEDTKSRIMNQFVKERLNTIIKHHTVNIELIKQIEVTFRGCLVIEFILVAAALLSELLGGLENTYMELPFTLLMVSVDCFMGQKIMNASESFTRAVYGCHWENFDVNNMKTILTILTNSQKYLTLTMGGIKVLNFVYLGSIIQSIYSAFTTLNSMMK